MHTSCLKQLPNEVSQIISSALTSVVPAEAVIEFMKSEIYKIVIDRGTLAEISDQRIFIIGVGKAVQSMASALVDLFGNQILSGLIIAKHINSEIKLPDRIRVILGSHPVPDEKSIESTRALVDFTRQFRENDIVFCLISGGGSSLMTLPVNEVKFEDFQHVTRLLLCCGANIWEINTIRKHLDQVKGGGLARFVFPAKLITLILSDVIGNPMDVIASGPTVYDSSTYKHAIEILTRYGIWEKTPLSIQQYLKNGLKGLHPETLKGWDQNRYAINHFIVGDNFRACNAAHKTSQLLGFNSLLLTTHLRGEAREAGLFLGSILQEISSSGYPLPRPCCIIVGGETTVNLRGSGKGGRNQEVALGAVEALAGLPDVALVTLATDGEDGLTDAAGAVVTGETLKKGLDLGLKLQEFLDNNDSYHYFTEINSLLTIGPTGTNVNDINFLFAFEQQ